MTSENDVNRKWKALFVGGKGECEIKSRKQELTEHQCKIIKITEEISENGKIAKTELKRKPKSRKNLR